MMKKKEGKSSLWNGWKGYIYNIMHTIASARRYGIVIYYIQNEAKKESCANIINFINVCRLQNSATEYEYRIP